MRKYIHKFKNYTSVEVDNLHDLKEGDLALYEDKFVTRNNGKVEEVVKSGGGSGEEEYSTDYPEDFIVQEWSNGTEIKTNFLMKNLVEKDQNTLFSNFSPSSIYIDRLILRIPNLDTNSVIVEYQLPEIGILNNGSTFDLAKLFTGGTQANNLTLKLGKDSDNSTNSIRIGNSNSIYTIPVTIKFKTLDGKLYKVPINNMNVCRVTGADKYRYIKINSDIPLKNFKVKYTELL